jgi:PAS domain S-box-containing protein
MTDRAARLDLALPLDPGIQPTELALRASEERFRILAEASPQFVWSSRPDGRIEYINPQWGEYTGLTLEESSAGEHFERSIHPDDAPIVRSLWEERRGTGEPFELQYRLRRAADGAYRWFLARSVPIRNAQGEVLQWLGTATDIDDYKREDEERRHLLDSERAARAELERASRIKDEFVATLSHELRTPLNAILGWTQLLRARGADPQKVQQGLEVIERNARTQAQMISDLLDVSRVISGKMRLDPRWIDLAAVVDQAAGSIRLAAEAKGIRLEEVRHDGEVRLYGDPDRLQQVVWNLLSNAIKFTPRGGRVVVGLDSDGSSAEIRVTDDGQGFAPELAPSLFERFRQADASTTRRHGGLGLGLSIVKQLVELHGGTVQAESPGEGLGATFRILLPLAATFAPEVGDVPAAPEAGAPAAFESPDGSLRGVRVLVVDDQPDAREFVRRLLEEREAEVETAASAAEALERIRARAPHVLLSDLSMPDEDGFSLVRRLRALDAGDGGGIPAVALSALARTEDRARALEAGYQVHLAKPLDPNALIAAVASLARPPQAV